MTIEIRETLKRNLDDRYVRKMYSLTNTVLDTNDELSDLQIRMMYSFTLLYETIHRFIEDDHVEDIDVSNVFNSISVETIDSKHKGVFERVLKDTMCTCNITNKNCISRILDVHDSILKRII